MSRLYRQVGPEEPLAQGDILHNIPAPDFSFNPLYRLVAWDGEVFRAERVDGDVQQGMNILATVDLVPAIVLDQSCDALGVDRILLAPLVDCDLAEKPPKDQWDYISKLGTSLHTPTRMYLSDDPVLGLPRRYIDLGTKFVLSREDVEFFVKRGKRVGTLSLKNLIYFQHRLAVAFSRIARDDIDWLSRADLAFKRDVLQAEGNKKRQGLESKEAALAKAQTAGEREDLEDEIEARKRVLQDIEYELSVAKKALAEVEKSEDAAPALPRVLPEEPRESHRPPVPAGTSVPAEEPAPENASPNRKD